MGVVIILMLQMFWDFFETRQSSLPVYTSLMEMYLTFNCLHISSHFNLILRPIWWYSFRWNYQHMLMIESRQLYKSQTYWTYKSMESSKTCVRKEMTPRYPARIHATDRSTCAGWRWWGDEQRWCSARLCCCSSSILVTLVTVYPFKRDHHDEYLERRRKDVDMW